ncbi:MAG: undecaprenyl-diphosphate phosphatase [Alistipes sp.]|nr:undecaprenyl-diphosphate phosphatase [Alistipes sp.]MDE6779108.1 undecaprenyl-diphosphate phosphatase [Alistipes sp.]
METIEAIILGIVQGLTEFLPVSSSGHLQIAKALLGVHIEQNVTFDVILHGATVLSTVTVMWRELWRLLCGVFSRRFNEEQAYVLKIIVSMIPAGVVGVLFADRIEALFSSLAFVGAMLLLTAALLAFAYYAKPRQKSSISYRDAFVIGLAQAAATMPGLSRSGSTIATGLLLGNSKESVAHFSFIMVIPVILGKMLLDAVSGEIGAMSVDTAPLVAGFAAAYVSGALACKFMIEVVKRGKLVWFAVYCAAAGLLSIISSVL